MCKATRKVRFEESEEEEDGLPARVRQGIVQLFSFTEWHTDDVTDNNNNLAISFLVLSLL